MLLLLDHLGDTGLAVAALAAPHGGAGTVLDAGHGADAQRIADRIQDLGLSHGLAAAYHLTVQRIFFDGRHLLLMAHLMEAFLYRTHRIKALILLRLFLFY